MFDCRVSRMVLIVFAGLALSLPACGDDTDPRADERQVRTAVKNLQRSFLERDMDGVCARMTNAAKIQVGALGHASSRESCATDLRQALRLIDAGGGLHRASKTRIARVRLDGDRATATVILGGWTGEVPFTRSGSRWILDSFFGVPSEEARQLINESPTRPFPASTAAPSGDFSRNGRPCSDFSTDESGDVASDCELSVSAETDVTILTVFGDFKFARCRVGYASYLDGTGRTRTSFGASGRGYGKAGVACGDLEPCFKDNPGNALQWKGRLEGAGRGALLHEIDTCFWTCVGYFHGRVAMRLLPGQKGWRAETTDIEVGASGLRMQGALAVSPPSFGTPSLDS